MNVKLYLIFDRVSCEYSPIFYANTQAHAIRIFRDAILAAEPKVPSPGDKILLSLGSELVLDSNCSIYPEIKSEFTTSVVEIFDDKEAKNYVP